ncbi:MAG TPA: UDP-N-acetylglucosamine 2-epimerase (non-hydrolyzing) [Anaerolineales bacterium]|nr:UDP-N-acetylglucosamine 2-epimerase (non-hydrolyzing) [Anaerolineales bacterium]
MAREKPVREIVTVVGARPQFIKAAVLSRLLREKHRGELSEFLVHTGQHYDDNMSEIFFRQMRIPEPDANLGVGSGSHGRQTGAMLAALEEVLAARRPERVLIYGDTNSTLAGSLAAAKLGIPVAHVEAGLRSFQRAMPEEINRIVADRLSDLLFCPTPTAVGNLAAEGIREGVHLVGDVMFDASLYYRRLIAEGGVELRLPPGLPADFYLLTLHRAENTDDPARLQAIVEALNGMDGHSAVFPVHPRTRKMLAAQGLSLAQHIRAIEPVGYLEMLALENRCRFVVTDSGGVQKEAFFFGKPCITLRDQTEWVETVQSGWNTLAGADPARIRGAFLDVRAPAQRPAFYGDGDSGSKILSILASGAEV